MSCTLENHRAEIHELLIAALAQVRTDAPQLLSIADPLLAGRLTAGTLRARLPIPAFTNSQMDGYALLSQDIATASTQHPVNLPLGFTAAAGDGQQQLEPGSAVPVMTGAPVPLGADTVVPVEETVAGRFPALVRAGAGTPSGEAAFVQPSAPQRFIRERGEQLEQGAVLAEEGSLLTPTLIGALAASGLHEVPVLRKPRALLCTTGDELTAPGEELAAGRIPDANGPMLAALLRGYGVEPHFTRLPDDPSAFVAHLQAAAAQADFVLTVGGISAGAFEVVRQALEPLGATFHHVALQPGGPQGLARIEAEDGRGVPVVCFPGNPVSALLSAELFLAPLLRDFSGLPEPQPHMHELCHDVHSPVAKHQVRRALLDNDQVRVLDPGSHLVHDLARADALVHIPVGVSFLPAGTRIETWSLNV